MLRDTERETMLNVQIYGNICLVLLSIPHSPAIVNLEHYLPNTPLPPNNSTVAYAPYPMIQAPNIASSPRMLPPK